MLEGKKILVVSAHAADYVWRSGGTIAHYVKGGADVHVVCLSYGIRGESNDLWKKGGQTYESVKTIRKGETLKAAEILGIKEKMEFWDLQDYCMNLTPEIYNRLVAKIREVRPDIIITHDKYDVLNPDHNHVSEMVVACSIMSNSSGVLIGDTKVTKQMRLYGFEPHQTELCHFQPGSFVDITDVYEQKVAAMQCFQAQKHLIKYYTDRAFLRGNHAKRISGNQGIKYAECFANYFPTVGNELY